jgi:hypothetical protein
MRWFCYGFACCHCAVIGDLSEGLQLPRDLRPSLYPLERFDSPSIVEAIGPEVII